MGWHKKVTNTYIFNLAIRTPNEGFVLKKKTRIRIENSYDFSQGPGFIILKLNMFMKALPARTLWPSCLIAHKNIMK